jgi:hypothetical protein
MHSVLCRLQYVVVEFWKAVSTHSVAFELCKQRVKYSFPQSRCAPVLYVQVLNDLGTIFIEEAYHNHPFFTVLPRNVYQADASYRAV